MPRRNTYRTYVIPMRSSGLRHDWRQYATVSLLGHAPRQGFVLRYRFRGICATERRNPLIQTGDSLGAMTSELKPDEYIAEYVGAGPKITLTGRFILPLARARRSVK